MNNLFIITDDDKTKQILINCGLTQVSTDNGSAIFLNEPKKLKFTEDIDQTKLRYTNKLYF